MDRPEDADVVVVNTCGFIESAKQESVDTILSVGRLKKEGRLKGVVAVGCLAQRYGEDLGDSIPELDAVLGLSDYSGIPGVVRKIVNGTETRFVATADGGRPKNATSDKRRALLTPKSYAFLRISEGCDHKCSFCAIPSMRGRNRSKPLEVLVEEARQLAAQGVKEIVVVAEDSTAYGLDIDRKRRIRIPMALVHHADRNGAVEIRGPGGRGDLAHRRPRGLERPGPVAGRRAAADLVGAPERSLISGCRLFPW